MDSVLMTAADPTLHRICPFGKEMSDTWENGLYNVKM